MKRRSGLLFMALMITQIAYCQDHDKFPATFYVGSDNSKTLDACDCKSNPTLKVRFKIPAIARRFDKVEVCLVRTNVRSKKGQLLVHKAYYRGAFPSQNDLIILQDGRQSRVDFNPVPHTLVCGGFKEKDVKVRVYGYMITGYDEKYEATSSSFVRTPIYGSEELIGESDNTIKLSQGGRSRSGKLVLVGAGIGLLLLLSLLS